MHREVCLVCSLSYVSCKTITDRLRELTDGLLRCTCLKLFRHFCMAFKCKDIRNCYRTLFCEVCSFSVSLERYNSVISGLPASSFLLALHPVFLCVCSCVSVCCLDHSLFLFVFSFCQFLLFLFVLSFFFLIHVFIDEPGPCSSS